MPAGDRRIPLFQQLEVETRSTCNRACPGCLRNSHPDRAALRPWFESHELPGDLVERLLTEALALGFHGPVCLQHYNEPLQDPRITAFGRRARALGFPHVFICTNGDYITEAVAAELDGAFHELQVALYMDEPAKGRRQQWLATLFRETRLHFTGGGHIPTHFSPLYDVAALANQNRIHPCGEPLRRLIINHRGDMLLCCDDLAGHFGLGNLRDHTVEQLWFGDRHQNLVLALQAPGGRWCHPHCLSCPRP
jgi:hypothetical protein